MTAIAIVQTAALGLCALAAGILTAAVWASGRPLRGHRAPTRLHTLGTALRRAGHRAADVGWRGALWLRVWRHDLEPLPARDEATLAWAARLHEDNEPTGPLPAVRAHAAFAGVLLALRLATRRPQPLAAPVPPEDYTRWPHLRPGLGYSDDTGSFERVTGVS